MYTTLSLLLLAPPSPDPEPAERTLKHPSEVRSVAFSPDGKRLATGCADGGVRVWDLTTGKLLRVGPAHGHSVTGLAFTRDGDALVSASLDGTVRVTDAVSLADRARLRTEGPLLSLALSPDGKFIAVGTRAGEAKVLELARLIKEKKSPGR